MKKSKAETVFWISAFTALIFGGLAVLSHIVLNNILGVYKSNVSREVLEFEPVNYIEINALNVDVNVSCWEGEMIQIIYNCDSPPVIETTGSKVSLSQEANFVITMLALDKFDFGITVKLPEKQFKRLKVTTNSGNIYTDDIPSEILSLTAVSGDIYAKQIKSQLILDNEKGSSVLGFNGLENDVLIETNNGNVEMTVPKDDLYLLQFQTRKGQLISPREEQPIKQSITKSYGETPHRLAINTVSGEVIIKYPD